MPASPSLFDRIWSAHEIRSAESGESLLWIDRHYLHEGSFHAFDRLRQRGLSVAEPALTLGVADHYVPTLPAVRRGSQPADPALMGMVERLTQHTHAAGIPLIGLDDPRQGIVHVTGPEQGLTQPGMVVVCGDSHTSTHGALGAMGFGIGASEVAHVLATQTLWQVKPRTLELRFEGALRPGVSAKDMALHWIARLGADGARGHAIEYTGDAVRALSMEARLTLCNLSIEGGARCGLVSPDALTIDWLRGRPGVPEGRDFERAAALWLGLASTADSHFDSRHVFSAADIEPTVTWGVSPEEALAIGATVPDPRDCRDAAQAARVADSLAYMGLHAGQRLTDIAIDRIFIGSCTNARLSDLRQAAAVLRGQRAAVPGWVSPGSQGVKRAAEAEGLHEVFLEAGLEWREPGCSLCVGMNGDLLAPGERCASTTNRNFKGRQGPGSRTHLMSPAMAAAAALTGRLTDVRPLLEAVA
jgi:3-isopropylmalate/(R)-2-methylmalate dehydratase large subunit